MRIGVDVDGVLYKWEATARYMLRNVLPGSPYRTDQRLLKPSTGWDYIQQCVHPKDWKWLWDEGVRLGLFRHGHNFPGTVEGMRALAQLGDVVIITHRPQAAVNDTLEWLSYQRLPLAGVHLLTRMEPKSSVRPMCDIYIDDKPANCVDLYNETTGAVAIMDRPWNQHFDPPGETKKAFERVYNMQEFVEMVKRVCG